MTLDLNNLPLLGVIACVIVGGLFLFFGNKKDLMTWLGTIVAIVAILFLTTHWAMFSHLPVVSASAQVVSTPVPTESVHPTIPAQSGKVQVKPTVQPAPRAVVQATPSQQPFEGLISTVASVCGFGLLALIGTIILLLVAVRRRNTTSTSSIVGQHERITP